jgi:mannose-6-phosphate isomerase-like protein (cupin superfamily)
MKRIQGSLIVLFALSAIGPVTSRAQESANPLPATFVTSENVTTGLNRDPQKAVNPQPNLRVVDGGGFNVAVGAIHRPQTPPGVAAVHFKVTEVYHVLEGGGTFVTGGKLVNPKIRPADSVEVTQEDGPGASGSSIEGGESHHVKAGDVVVIPAGTPHWFSKIDGAVSYIVVRIDPNQILTRR